MAWPSGMSVCGRSSKASRLKSSAQCAKASPLGSRTSRRATTPRRAVPFVCRGALPHQESDFAFFTKYPLCEPFGIFNQATTSRVSFRQKGRKQRACVSRGRLLVRQPGEVPVISGNSIIFGESGIAELFIRLEPFLATSHTRTQAKRQCLRLELIS